MGRGSQRKGRSGERELSLILQKEGFNVMVGDPVSFGSVPDLIGLPGIHIECKRVERLNISEAMKQSINDSLRFKDGFPVVMHRRNRETWLVSMRLEDWLAIYKKAEKHKEDG